MADRPDLPYCSDCGDARVPHLLAKFDDGVSLLAELVLIRTTAWISTPIVRLFDLLPYDKPAALLLVGLSRIGIGEIAHTFDERDSIRTKALWESANALGIKQFQYRLRPNHSHGFMVATLGPRTLVYQIMPRPKGKQSRALQWMDDKGLLKKKLAKAKLPTARGGAFLTVGGALRAFRRLVPPVIVKPHFGSRGRHTTLSITNEAELRRAFAIGKQIAFSVVMEEEFRGTLYRVSLIGGKPAAVLRRDYPHVIGDGTLTVRELMEKENRDPRRDGFAFYPLMDNERMDRELTRQGLTRESTPSQGQFVILNDKVSRLHGTTTADVTDEVHPEMMELFAKIGSFLGDAVVGIDFIVEDITRAPQEQSRFGVVECNTMPYLDLHHYPYEGKSRPVSADLWKICFPELSS